MDLYRDDTSTKSGKCDTHLSAETNMRRRLRGVCMHVGRPYKPTTMASRSGTKLVYGGEDSTTKASPRETLPQNTSRPTNGNVAR